jgi:hypothetical protein
MPLKPSFHAGEPALQQLATTALSVIGPSCEPLERLPMHPGGLGREWLAHVPTAA